MLQGSDQLIAMVMTCASAWMEPARSDPEGGQRWVVYDEAWRLLAPEMTNCGRASTDASSRGRGSGGHRRSVVARTGPPPQAVCTRVDDVSEQACH